MYLFSHFRYDKKVEHYRVRRDERTWVTVDDEEYFENLFKLVEVKLLIQCNVRESSYTCRSRAVSIASVTRSTACLACWTTQDYTVELAIKDTPY